MGYLPFLAKLPVLGTNYDFSCRGELVKLEQPTPFKITNQIPSF